MFGEESPSLDFFQASALQSQTLTSLVDTASNPTALQHQSSRARSAALLADQSYRQQGHGQEPSRSDSGTHFRQTKPGYERPQASLFGHTCSAVRWGRSQGQHRSSSCTRWKGLARCFPGLVQTCAADFRCRARQCGTRLQRLRQILTSWASLTVLL